MTKRKHQNLTAEDRARHERIQAWCASGIAYHEAKALEEEQAAEQARTPRESS